jgi:serine/threonine-protein kinase
MIRLHTVGGLDLRNEEGVELRAIVAQPKRLALLAYLAIATPHGFHRRDSILSLFWPERDLEHARASLSRAVYFLRRELGPAVLLSRGNEELGLDRGRVWCDAAALDDALEREDYGHALELYRGELLPGFFLSEAAGFEEWLEAQRRRLRDSASEAVWRLAEQEEAAGRFAAATRLARRGAELAPFREDAFRRFLALLDRTGDRAAAAEAYRKFSEEIARELEVAPSPETQQLIDAIKSRTGPSIVSVDTQDPDRIHVSNEPTSTGNAFTGSDSPRPPSDATRGTVRRLRRLTTRPMLATAVVVAALAIVGAVLKPPIKPTIDPLRVDVVAWTNRTGNHSFDRLGLVAAQRLVDAIHRSGIVKNARIYEPSSGTRAGILVTGEFDRTAGEIHARVLISDVRRGGTAWSLTPIVVPFPAPEQAVDSVRPHVLGALSVLQDASDALLFPLATAPPTIDAYQEFLEGVKLQSEGRIVDALNRYRWAAGIDSSFTWALVHGAMVSLSWYRADMRPQTDSLLATLSVTRRRLTPLQSHLFDYMTAARAEDWVGAYRAMQGAAALASRQYTFNFARLALDANRPRESADALMRSGMDSIYRYNIQGYWRTLTYALHLLDRHDVELANARRARRLDPKSASGLVFELRALTALGRLAEVSAGLDTVFALSRDGWLTPAYAAVWVSSELRAHGYNDLAATAVQRAIAWYRSRPADERASQEWREWFAETLYLAGNWTAADTAFKSLLHQFPASFGYPDNAYYLGRIGAIAAHRGDELTAKQMSKKLIATDRYQSRPGQESRLYRARIAALLGDRDEAMRLLTAAYGPSGGIELHEDADFEGMKSYPPFREFVRPKG